MVPPAVDQAYPLGIKHTISCIADYCRIMYKLGILSQQVYQAIQISKKSCFKYFSSQMLNSYKVRMGVVFFLIAIDKIFGVYVGAWAIL